MIGLLSLSYFCNVFGGRIRHELVESLGGGVCDVCVCVQGEGAVCS